MNEPGARRRTPWGLRMLLAASLVAALLAVAWYLGSPLLIRSTLVELSPLAAPTSVAQAPVATAVPVALASTAVVPVTATAAAPSMAAAVVPSPSASPTATAEPAPGGPVVLGVGSFDVKDAIHKGSGTASLVRLADGELVVHLENFSVTNGPDLFVYVSGHPSPSNSRELHLDELNLGRLKATDGSFSYAVPATVDGEKVRSVVIYCRAFTTVFS